MRSALNQSIISINHAAQSRTNRTQSGPKGHTVRSPRANGSNPVHDRPQEHMPNGPIGSKSQRCAPTNGKGPPTGALA
eukprot:2919965-Prymnesium_polylepis.1